MKKILVSILLIGLCPLLFSQTTDTIYDENFETWPLSGWINYNQLAEDGATEDWGESGDTAVIIADPDYNTQHQWFISAEYDIPEQPIARGSITVTKADTADDAITVTINGIQADEAARGGTTTEMADSITDIINTQIDGYTATVSEAKVSIVADSSGAKWNGAISLTYAHGTGGDGENPEASKVDMAGGEDLFASGTITVLSANHVDDGVVLTLDGSTSGNTIKGETTEILASNITAEINTNAAYDDYAASVNDNVVTIVSVYSGVEYNGDITYTYSNSDGTNPELEDTDLTGGISYDFSFKWKTSFFRHCNGTYDDLYTGNPIEGWNNADIKVGIMQNPEYAQGSIGIEGANHVNDSIYVTIDGITVSASGADSILMSQRLRDSINDYMYNYTATAAFGIVTITANVPGTAFNYAFTVNDTTLSNTDGSDPVVDLTNIGGGNGTWTNIWREDNETLVSNSTDSILSSDDGNDPWTYEDFEWYKSDFDITDYNGSTVIFGFEYEGRNGDAFYLDSLMIKEITPPDVTQPTSPEDLDLELTAYEFTEYTHVPITQVDDYGFSAKIRNKGKDLEEPTFVTVRVEDENSTEVFSNYQNVTLPFLENQIKDYDLTALDDDFFKPEYISDYSFEYEVEVIDDTDPLNNVDELSLSVTDSVYAIDNGNDDGGIGFFGQTGSLGSVFEMNGDDHISSVSIYFNDDPAEDEEFSFALFQVTNWADTSTAFEYVSDVFVKSTGDLGQWLTFPIDYWEVKKDSSYIFVINQLDTNNIDISYDDDGGELFYTLDYAEWTATENFGNIMMRVNMKNRAPEFLTEPLYNSSGEIIAVEGKAFTLQNDSVGVVKDVIMAYDPDDDDLQFLADEELYPGTYIPDWLTLTDNGDGTASIGCAADVSDEEDLGEHDITIALTDGSIDTIYQSMTIKLISGEVPYTGLPTTYDVDFDVWPEEGWTTEDDLLETGSTEHWEHNAVSEIATITGDAEFEQSEWLYSRPVYIPVIENLGPDTVMLAFDWATDFEMHAGGTFGVIGSGNPVVDYNMADIRVYLIDEDYNATQIWQEDDQSLLEATNTVVAGTEDLLEWPFVTGQWYTSYYDLAAYSGERVIIAFQYTGLDGSYFNLDNFKVSLIERPTEVDIKIFANISTDYTHVPLSQIDDDYTMSLDVINRGIPLQEDSYLTVEASVADINHDFEYEDYEVLPAGFATYDTANYAFDVAFVPDAEDTYTFTFNAFIDDDVNTTNNENIQLTFDVDTLFALDNNTKTYDVEADRYDNNDGEGLQFIGGRLGNVFELNEDDVLTTISVYFGNIPADVEFGFAVYEDFDISDTTATIFFTSELFTRDADGDNSWATFDIEDLNMPAGTYLISIIQVEDQPFNVGQDDTEDGFFVRGWQDEDLWIDEEDDEGYLMLRANFYDEVNESPKFKTLTAEQLQARNNAALNINYNYTVVAEDDNINDVLVFEAVTLPDWLSFTDNGNRTATITGTPTLVDLGSNLVILSVTDGTDTVSQSFNIIVEGNPVFVELEEDFDDFTTNQWEVDWAKDSVPESGTHWDIKDDDAYITADIDAGPPVKIRYQYEWLISKTIYIPVLGADSTIMLSFDFKNDFFNNCGGTFDQLYTGNLIDGFNNADMKVLISDDDGNTWDELWREDDQTTLQNTTTIRGSDTPIPWPYDSATWYTAQIDITAYEGEMVNIAFYYEGRNGGDFAIDTVSVTKAFIEEFADLEIIGVNPSMYTQTPFHQLQTYDIMAEVVNNGAELNTPVSVLAEVIGNDMEDTLLYESVDITLPLAFRDTQSISFSSIMPMEEGTYNIDFSAYYIDNVSGALIESDTETLHVSAELYALDDGTSVGSAGVDNSGDAIGNIFEVFRNDHLDSVSIYFETAAAADLDFFISVYNFDEETMTGTLVGNTNVLTKEAGVAGTWVDFDINEINLYPGNYAIMVNQITDENIGIGYDEEGNHIKWADGAFMIDNSLGNLMLRVYLTNAAPEFESDAVLEGIQGFQYVYRVEASDGNNDVMTFDFTVKPDWLELIDSVNGFARLTGVPGIENTGSNLVVMNVTDGREEATQSFIINIEPNTPPEITSEPITEITEGENYGYTVIAQDTNMMMFETESIPGWLTLTQVDDTSAFLGGTPTIDDVGEDTVNLFVHDGMDTTYQNFVIEIFEANIEPVFTSIPVEFGTEGIVYTYNVEVEDEDTLDVLTIEGDDLPDWLSLTQTKGATAILTGLPEEDNIGLNDVVVFVHDGLDTVYQEFTINVKSNPAPAFTSTPIVRANEGEEYLYNVRASDANNEAITFTAVLMPDWLSFTDNGNGTAVLTGTPDETSVGVTTVKIQATDIYDNTSEQLFNLTVYANIAPVFVTEPDLEVQENELYTYQVRATDENVTNTLSFATVSLPDWLTLTDNGNGSALLTGTPAEGDVGTNSVIITVTDGMETVEQSFVVTVIAANNLPEFTASIDEYATEGFVYSSTLTATDEDGQLVTYNATGLPGWLSIINTGNNQANLSGTPGSNHVGINTFTVNITDGIDVVSQEFSVTVIGESAAPQFITEPVTDAIVDSLYEYNLLASVSGGGSLTFTVMQMPEWMTFTEGTGGEATLSGTPSEDDLGGHDVVIKVSDGQGVAKQAFVVEVRSLVSAGELNKNTLAVYPNPAKNELKIENALNSKVFIYNAAGNIQDQIMVNANLISLDLTAYAAGIYYIRILTEQESITKKIVLIK